MAGKTCPYPHIFIVYADIFFFSPVCCMGILKITTSNPEAACII
ncbi:MULTISPECIES: hypothetical protein [unclassified Microcoleus]